MSKMLELDEDTYELVRGWRLRTGSQLSAIWAESDHSANNHLQVIFGNIHSNRPLSTPLAQVICQEHEVDLEAHSLELWEQPWMVPHPGILDFEASKQRMRVVVATTTDVSPELIDRLLRCVKENVDRDLPDYLLTA